MTLPRRELVDKRFESRYLKPAGMLALARKYPGEFAVGAGTPIGIGMVTAQQNARGRRQAGGRSQPGAAKHGALVGGGAAAGSIGYTAGGLGLMAGPDRAFRAAQGPGGYGDMSRNQFKNAKKKHWAKHGATSSSVPTTPAQEKAIYRNFPREFPAWKRQRALGYIGRGKIGRGVQAGFIAGGAFGADQLSKALYVHEQRVSPTRVLEAGAGLAIGAWGVGRSRMVGRALGHGLKAAGTRGNDRAVYALQAAQAAQGVLRRGTAPGERALRQIQQVDRAVSAVPASLRPEVATAAGLLLTGNAMPLRRERYTPVSRPIPVRAVGW